MWNKIGKIAIKEIDKHFWIIVAVIALVCGNVGLFAWFLVYALYEKLNNICDTLNRTEQQDACCNS